MENYRKRRKNMEKALRELRRQGLVTAPPSLTAQGEMIVFLRDGMLTSTQILSLFDSKELTPEGIRKLIEQKRSSEAK
jgi:hypothetical protein